MSSIAVTPGFVAELLSRGVDEDDVVRLLVATGAWSESGAAEIVSMFEQHDGETTDSSAPVEPTDWPGPIEEPAPLFAT